MQVWPDLQFNLPGNDTPSPGPPINPTPRQMEHIKAAQTHSSSLQLASMGPPRGMHCWALFWAATASKEERYKCERPPQGPLQV